MPYHYFFSTVRTAELRQWTMALWWQGEDQLLYQKSRGKDTVAASALFLYKSETKNKGMSYSRILIDIYIYKEFQYIFILALFNSFITHIQWSSSLDSNTQYNGLETDLLCSNSTAEGISFLLWILFLSCPQFVPSCR